MVQTSVLAISFVALVLASSAAFVYLSTPTTGPTGTGSTSTSSSNSPTTTRTTPISSSTITTHRTTIAGTSTSQTGVFQVSIPPGSGVAPPGFNVTSLLTGTFRYKFNFTVIIGVNNTIRWVNDDSVDHTVSSFVIPNGAAQFNSGLIFPGGTFSVVLTVPGEYRYTCIWHPYLAGEIRVMPAS